MYHYTECGLDNIYLRNGYQVIDDPKYGECVSVMKTEELHAYLAKGIVENSPSLTGEEFRFLRKEMNQSQKCIAELFGVKEGTVARWEKNLTNISRTTDAAMRGLFLDSKNEDGNVAEQLRNIAELEAESHKLQDKLKVLEKQQAPRVNLALNNDWKSEPLAA